MGANAEPRDSDVPIFLVFTDLDGTLLDHDTYSWGAAAQALEQCKAIEAPVILVSSKTRAEIDRLHRSLALSAPFISENGGGIFFPCRNFEAPPADAARDRGFWKWSLGVPYERLIKALHEIREALGWNLRGFSDMNLKEISRRTGLDMESAAQAAQREYDEPFVILEKQTVDEQALSKAAESQGLRITIGGRFYHLHGQNDKGRAVEKVRSWYALLYGEVRCIALGDSPNDFPMLALADYPVLVRSKRDLTDLAERIPGLHRTREMGPEGWNSAVMDILGGKRQLR